MQVFLTDYLRNLAQMGTMEPMSTYLVGDRVPEWTVGDRLRKARELLDLDQGQFAELIGVSRGTVSNYERGTVDRYKPIVLRAWALATDVSAEWLETGTASHSGPTPPDRGQPNEKLARLTEQKRSRVRGPSTTRQYLVPAFTAA